MTDLVTDVLIVGAGAAGLSVALHLPSDVDILVADKGAPRQGSTPWAQGGVAAAVAPDDSPELHQEDTMRLSVGHGDASAIAVLCSEAPECVLELAELGCDFDRNPDGTLHVALEGGQSVPRSVHSADATGAAIIKTLRDQARERVRRVEGRCVKLAIAEGRCVGAWILTSDGVVAVRAAATVVATGGIGGLFERTTNPPGASGDGVVVAWEAGAGVADLEFVQFHPTTLAVGGEGQKVLLTEALRGAGALVVDAEGRRFLFEYHADGELAPRDVVARAVASRRAWLDCRHLGRAMLEKEFRSVTAACRSAGLDPADALLPIGPAEHYFIGGVQTDLDGRSSIPRLYAVGECATTGVHGANRLPGNSLAEALVFGRRAARAIAGQRMGRAKDLPPAPTLSAPPSLDVDDEWRRLRSAVTEALGIERRADPIRGLIVALERLTTLPLSADHEANELRTGAVLARLIARSALLRDESRGVHHRTDHPEPEPAWAGMRLRLGRS